jgi:membrane protease YdiL (CAAX protease family)
MRAMLQRHPVRSYFCITFAISWSAALCVVSPWLLRGQSVPALGGILMFPAMLLGPSLTGLILVWLLRGPEGLRTLGEQLLRWRLHPYWYAVLLIPPVLVLGVLLLLQALVSKAFAPNLFLAGIAFGIPAGYLEELGWMGFAFDQLRAQRTSLRAAIVLGILWAVWHLPVADYLGAAYPHGWYWLPFFCAFAAAMIAMRVLISWLYVNTGSLAATQLLHMSSTGALVIFAAPGIGAMREVLWYGLYAIALWLVVLGVVRVFGVELKRPASSRSWPTRAASGAPAAERERERL